MDPEALEIIVKGMVPGYVPIPKEHFEYDHAASAEQSEAYIKFLISYASYRAGHIRPVNVTKMTVLLKNDPATPYAPRMKRMLGEAAGGMLGEVAGEMFL